MRLTDALLSAFEALRAHALRSLLTMLGIVIGVAAVISMVSVGGGAREQVNAQIRSLGANLIIIVPGNVTFTGVRGGLGQSSTLTDDDARQLKKEIPTLQAVSALVRGNVQVLASGTNWGSTLVGVDEDYFEAREWEIEKGRGFSPDEALRGGQVALLGQTVATQLFGEDSPLGQTIRIRNVPFEVIGIMGKKGQTMFGTDQDDVVIVPLPTGRARITGRNRARTNAVHQILAKVKEGENISAAENDMRSLLRQRHRLPEAAEDDFNVRNMAEINATREASSKTLALLLASVAGVSLLVGGIGIMNIMLVSVTERTREIGVRMAVGARPSDVMSQFLIEAVVLALIGGLIGIMLGFIIARFVANAAGWPLLIDYSIVLLAVVSSGLIGVLSGFYPAWRASKLDPVEALRSV